MDDLIFNMSFLKIAVLQLFMLYQYSNRKNLFILICKYIALYTDAIILHPQVLETNFKALAMKQDRA